MSDTSRPQYLRLQARYYGRIGVEVGIFVAVDHLRRAGRLTPSEELLYVDIDDWFETNLPNPPFYEDGNTVGAVTWFKRASTAGMLGRLQPLRGILTAYDVPHVLAESADPGTIVYEDPFQVGVVPYRRHEPTPLPQDVVLGPTTAGSKRHLIQRYDVEAAASEIVPSSSDDGTDEP